MLWNEGFSYDYFLVLCVCEQFHSRNLRLSFCRINRTSLPSDLKCTFVFNSASHYQSSYRSRIVWDSFNFVLQIVLRVSLSSQHWWFHYAYGWKNLDLRRKTQALYPYSSLSNAQHLILQYNVIWYIQINSLFYVLFLRYSLLLLRLVNTFYSEAFNLNKNAKITMYSQHLDLWIWSKIHNKTQTK